MAFTHLAHIRQALGHVQKVMNDRGDDDKDLDTAVRALLKALPRYSREVCFSNPCEWNQKKGRAAYDYEVHARADLVVGAKGEWRLCNECAALPRFSRFRKQTPVRRTSKEAIERRMKSG